MLEPREADIPAFILVLVVLPLVSYILLGRWNEASKKKARISLLAQLAAEEAIQVESVTTVSVIVPVINCPSKAGFHMCARCYAPATTRCSRCKSVRYCSGNCQILHWRQVHKLECQQLDDSNSTLCFDVDSSVESVHQRALLNEIPKPALDNIQLDASLHPPISTVTPTTLSDRSADPEAGRKPLDKWASRSFYEETSRGEAISSFVEESNSVGPISPVHSKEVPTRHKFRKNNSIASSDEIPKKHNISSPLISVRGPPYKIPDQNGSVCEPSSGLINCSTSYSERNGINSHDILTHFNSEKASFVRDNDLSSSSEKILGRGIIRSKSPYCILEGKIPMPRRSTKASKEYLYTSSEKEHPVANEPSSSLPVAVQGSNGVSKSADTKMVEPKKLPKLPSDALGLTSNGLRKNKVLFPYEEFVKFFHCEAWNLSPRGLLNCGNSCYANAVLQCLTSTKPLSIYLLQRSHSRTCRARDWCLMCELEQHVATLKEYRGPLSPSRILSNMRSIGCRMGGGNQEDAHEFLRLLVASMQSICLEGVGSEKEVDPRLQETTFIQHTFGGRLRSKVKCLRCQHESERYDNIMDLTLEILGWVESLEDALTQFTAPEDLDGENMYRCGRCATYVKARKQLSVHEAPNILTIVLKRFQTGKYGKINKCITFPDMLDMIPFMTETGDCPPLYMLYGLVVHLDTLNASFSGHYVSYIKDLQGTWFRIDDTQVEPVSMSQVMSEGAYILFYSRSYPRPLRVYYNGKTIPIQAPVSAKNVKSKAQKTRHSQNTKPMSFPQHSQSGPTTNGASVPRQEIYSPASRDYSDPLSTDYSDATSSDWSLFTSSDESSFTTESTRDSCSTIDYTDTLNGDPVYSLFGTFCMPEYSTSTISCKKSSSYRPQTRFFSESKGFVMESSRLEPQLGSFVLRGKNPEQATDSLTGTGSFVSTAVGNCSTFLRYGSNPKDSSVHKCGCCEL